MTKKVFLLLGLCLLVGAASVSAQAPCEVPFNPDGSVTLPPEGCEYQSPQDIHVLLDSLPDGTVVHVGASHGAFLCGKRGTAQGESPCTLGGGQLGGQIESASSTVKLSFSDSDGWSRTVYVPVEFEVHTGQKQPNQSSFPTLMTQLTGSANPGDADFEQIEIFAGADNGFAGKGQTDIYDLGNGRAQVKSNFKLSGTMTIVGTPGGRFEGVNGSFDFSTEVVAQDECD